MMSAEFRFVALIVTGVIIIIFPLQPFLPMEQLILISSLVAERPWTMFTHIFLHGSALHLLGNILSLGLFGSILERLVGLRAFLLVFFGGGLVSSLGDILFYEATLGASGALFAVLGAVTVLKPRMAVFAFGVPLPMFVAAALWAMLDLTGFFYPDNVAHAAHLFGMVAGGVLGLRMRKYLEEKKEEKADSIEDEKHRTWEEHWMKRPYPEEI